MVVGVKLPQLVDQRRYLLMAPNEFLIGKVVLRNRELGFDLIGHHIRRPVGGQGSSSPYPKFEQWPAMREGLWLADKNAVAGMSRIDPLRATQTKLKTPVQMKSKTPCRFKVGQVSKPAFLPHLRVSFASNPMGNRDFEL